MEERVDRDCIITRSVSVLVEVVMMVIKRLKVGRARGTTRGAQVVVPKIAVVVSLLNPWDALAVFGETLTCKHM